MKKSLFVMSLLALALLACTKKEYPPEPSEPGSVKLSNTYGAEIRTVHMDDRTTCYIVTREGNNAISCVRR